MSFIREYFKRRAKRKAARRLALLREVIRSDDAPLFVPNSVRPFEYAGVRRQVAEELTATSFGRNDEPRLMRERDESVAAYHVGRHHYERLRRKN